MYIYSMHLMYRVCTNNTISFPSVFKQLQKESEFQKKEWIRKQGMIICAVIALQYYLKMHVNNYAMFQTVI